VDVAERFHPSSIQTEPVDLDPLADAFLELQDDDETVDEATTDVPVNESQAANLHRVGFNRAFKPGTRQGAPVQKASVGEPPWWSAPRGADVWTEKLETFKARGGGDCKNLIGWRDVGTSTHVVAARRVVGA
jgi:hypothetical protein